jgi:NADH:ubiquinone oxidoreductase subunit B-like Fe-S oxidoreductase
MAKITLEEGKEPEYECPEGTCEKGTGCYNDSYYHCQCDWCVDHSLDHSLDEEEEETKNG